VSSLPLSRISGLYPFNLSAYGLLTCLPTLRADTLLLGSQGLATRWLARPSGVGFAPTGLNRYCTVASKPPFPTPRMLKTRNPETSGGVSRQVSSDAEVELCLLCSRLVSRRCHNISTVTRWPLPLSEPCLRYSRTRLPKQPFTATIVHADPDTWLR
jgi:hypothetical protein